MITSWQIDTAITNIDNALRLIPDEDIPMGSSISRRRRTLNRAQQAMVSARVELMAAKNIDEGEMT